MRCHRRTIGWFLLLISSSIAANAFGDNPHETLNVFRDADGALTQESEYAAELLLALADEHDHLVVWLTTQLPFNPNDEELTSQEAAEQQEAVAQEFTDILRPLFVSSVVSVNPDRPNVEGPGVSVIASSEGLAALIADPRLLNIGWTNTTTQLSNP